MRNAEAKVCRAAGPRREAPWGAGGVAVGEVCHKNGATLLDVVQDCSRVESAWKKAR